MEVNRLKNKAFYVWIGQMSTAEIKGAWKRKNGSSKINVIACLKKTALDLDKALRALGYVPSDKNENTYSKDEIIVFTDGCFYCFSGNYWNKYDPDEKIRMPFSFDPEGFFEKHDIHWKDDMDWAGY